MKSLILLCLISLSISCGQIDTRPKYISATSTTLEAEMAIAPMNLQIKDNLKSAPKFFEVSGRSIPTSNGIHSVDEYQNIQINGDTLTFEVTEKLYVVLSSSGFYPGITKRIGAVGFSKMVTVEATQEPEGEIEVVFREDSESFELKGEWYDGTIISLRYVYICTNKDLFYKSQYITVGSQGKKYGICKVSFEAKGDTILLGTKDNLLPFDGNKIYYEQACPVPRISLGGNNLILENELSTPYVNYIDNNIVKNNGTHFIIKYDNPRQGNLNTLVNVTFANSIDNEFVFPMNEDMILNTSTANTIKKAYEILANDNSDEPNYIKLGRWVNKNMKYDLSYSGAKMTVDEILSKLVGDCKHFTKLYNALLQSIGIKAVFISGYKMIGKDGKPENADSVRHAWTMAKIDGEWKAFDSTMGLFLDKFPISHVFGNNYDFTYDANYSEVSKPSPSNDLKFLGYIDQSTLRNLQEKIEEDLISREDNVKRKEAELDSKEKELNKREKTLNEIEAELITKENDLNNKEKDLEVINKESQLNKKEVDLNAREANLIPKEEELKKKETTLNNKELDLEVINRTLTNKESQLNEKEDHLNDRQNKLDKEELDLEVKNKTLITKESELNTKEDRLNDRQNKLDNEELELEVKNKTLINKESQLNEKEKILKEKEAMLDDEESYYKAKNETLTNKESELNEKEKLLNEKETNLNKEESDLKTKNQTLITKESQLNAKEKILNDRQNKLNKEELELEIKNQTLINIESQINTKEDHLNDREIKLNNRELNLNAKNETLIKKESQLNTKEDRLNDREIKLNNDEKYLNAKNETLINKETNLNAKEKHLNDRETMLNNKELYLEDKNETLIDKESDLEFKNETLINKESDLDEKEDYLNDKETMLNNVESDLNTKNETLINKETDLNGRETDLNTKESDLDKKEKDFNEKETSFNKKSDSNMIGLIIVCALLGISIALNIFLFIRAKKSKDMLESSANKNEKMTEMI